MKTYYAPTFLDASRTFPDKKGESSKTGNLFGILFIRTFKKMKSGKITATRSLKLFRWDKDNFSSKRKALKEAIKGLTELEEIDDNPPLNFIPEKVKIEALFNPKIL